MRAGGGNSFYGRAKAKRWRRLGKNNFLSNDLSFNASVFLLIKLCVSILPRQAGGYLWLTGYVITVGIQVMPDKGQSNQLTQEHKFQAYAVNVA